MTFGKFKFLASTLILNTRYKYPKNQINNLFYLFNDQFDYALAYYFVELETTKGNVNRFFFNSLMKFITKKLLYYNVNK